MKRLSLQNIFVSVVLLFFSVSFYSCLENEDIMTADARTGGIVTASPLIQYKPGAVQKDSILLTVYMGPQIASVKVFKCYVHLADYSVTDEVLLDEIEIGGQNSSDTLELKRIYTWEQLKDGFSTLGNGVDPFPASASEASVGDFFILRYESHLADGTVSSNRSKTKVLIANSFAGYYMSHFSYFHPTLGGSYPNDPYRQYTFKKQLITLTGNQCYMNFGLWGSYGETMYLTINPDNSISYEVVGFDYIVKEGDPYDPTKKSHYDPSTKKIYLYYYWEGPGGARVVWEELEPDF